jgi:hypothetical protein
MDEEFIWIGSIAVLGWKQLEKAVPDTDGFCWP